MQEKDYAAHRLMSLLLEECKDELEVLVADEVGEGGVVERIKKRIDGLFGPLEEVPEEIRLDQSVPDILDGIRPLFSHREIELVLDTEETPPVWIPADPLKKVVVGLIRNAVENTPDEGRIEVRVRRRGTGAEFLVRDYGVGIAPENQRRIFEGFFTTRETMSYSSRRPYDFNAGGKGIDLLRMRMFSERYRFRLHFTSKRCDHIPRDEDICPGRISACAYCREKGDCHRLGGSTFRVFFPSAAAHETRGNPRGS
jgi:signal transduction histidine kinase